MKVLLDTNIILNGALNKYTVARELVNTINKISYYVSYSSIDEVDRLLEKNCFTSKIQNKAHSFIRKYLKNLGCVILSPGNPILSLEIPDSDDRSIVSTAKENTINTICTYNIQDIINFNGKVKTPLELTREYSLNIFNSFFQIKDNKFGTIFSVIQPYHESSIGDIFYSDDGTEYFINKDGFFASSDSNSEIEIKDKIIAGKRIGLILRTKENFFEASFWTPIKGSKWYHDIRFEKKTIAKSKTELKTNIELKLATNTGKRHYSGHVMNVSVVPNFIKESQIQKALGAMCLDVIYGSKNLKTLLNEMHYLA